MKYFDAQRVKQAAEHLGEFNSAWVIVPLVLASNGVGTGALVNIDTANKPGTTRFLDRFFSGNALGLQAFANGRSVLRPKFADLKNSAASPADLAVHQRANLWGSTYSSRGYREMRVRGELDGTDSDFKVNQAFIPKWNHELPATFHFEELLVWLYGFTGFPDAVNSWQELFADYKQRVLNGINFDACFQSRFHSNNGVPWPANLLQQRPTNLDLIAVLLPSTLAAPVLPAIKQIGKDLTHSFTEEAMDSEVQLKEELALRFVDCILTKPFVILTGLAGSGKTKIAQAFARWITPKPTNAGEANPHYALIPVGADWTGNENIVGYPNGLDPKNYVTKPALELILHAQAHRDIPHFLILDEMNLSHVERYFADLLSAIESGEEIPLYEGDARTSDGTEIPRTLRLPDNLFIIGTVNVDETTYMFSPKVLDRANVIEFRMEADELAAFLASPKKPNLDELDGKGVAYAKDFIAAAADKSREVPAAVKADYEQEMLLFFKLLQAHSAEFGYRTGYESARFVHFYKLLGGFADADTSWFNGAMDCVIVQKFLPKLHGSRSKMEGLLWALAWACGAKRNGTSDDFIRECLEAGKAQDEGKLGPEKVLADLAGGKARYPLSFEKVIRMYDKLKQDQFVSFAEA